jgi:predicted Zn-dependent peptidase
MQVRSTTPFKKGEIVLDKISEIENQLLSYIDEDSFENMKRLAFVDFLTSSESVLSQMSLFRSLLVNKLDLGFYDRSFEILRNLEIEDISQLHRKIVKSNVQAIEVV